MHGVSVPEHSCKCDKFNFYFVCLNENTVYLKNCIAALSLHMPKEGRHAEQILESRTKSKVRTPKT